MRIEMLGPPTAGKSSLVRELVLSGIGKGNVQYHAPIPQTWESFAKRIESTYSDRMLFKKRLQSLPEKTLNALSTAHYGDQFKGPVVYDELVALCGLSMAIRHSDNWHWYFEQMPMPGLLVVLECSLDTIIKRNQARGERDRTKKSIRAFDKMAEIKPLIEKRGGNVIYLNTDELNSYQCAKQVLKCL